MNTFNLNLILSLLFIFDSVNLIKSINLDRNQLQTWYPNYNTDIWIDLAYKRVTSISNDTFAGMNNLQRLWFFNNQLTSLDKFTFAGLKSLQEIDLGYNQITHLDEGSFGYLTNLQIIDLQGNSISSIDRQTFVGLNNLGSVYLGSNPISMIQQSYVKQLCASNSKCTIYL